MPVLASFVIYNCIQWFSAWNWEEKGSDFPLNIYLVSRCSVSRLFQEVNLFIILWSIIDRLQCPCKVSFEERLPLLVQRPISCRAQGTVIMAGTSSLGDTSAICYNTYQKKLTCFHFHFALYFFFLLQLIWSLLS